MILPDSIEDSGLLCPHDDVPLSLVNGRWLFCAFCFAVTSPARCKARYCLTRAVYRAEMTGTPFCRVHGDAMSRSGIRMVAA